MSIIKYSSLIQIGWHFIHPFTLILVGLVAFPRLGQFEDRPVLTKPLFIYSLINFLSGGF
jgi:hypothetical protein